jgi:glycine cleavage system H protein
MNPKNLRYTKTHEWINIEGDSATVGITDHAQDALGDITFIELPKKGENVKMGGECGVIESVKAASDLYSPISGVVADVNESLETAPEDINNDPYGNGWIFKLEKINPAEINDLMNAADYEAFLESEE